METLSVGEGEAGLECLRAANDAKGGNVNNEFDGEEASAAGAPRHGTGDDDKDDEMCEGGSEHGKEVESRRGGGEDGVNGPAARDSEVMMSMLSKNVALTKGYARTMLKLIATSGLFPRSSSSFQN